MDDEITADWVTRMLGAQGIATDTNRAQAYAAGLAQMLKGAGPGFAQIPFEQEPAGFVAEQRKNAP